MLTTRHREGVALVRSLVALIVCSVGVFPTGIAGAEDFREQQAMVDKAEMTFRNFAADPDMVWFRANAKDAWGVFIVPQFLRGAFIFGGAGGSGVLMARKPITAKWTQPAFYTIGSASFGLQIGADASELILVIMTQKGLESFYTSSFKLGADVSIAAGPVGIGAKGQTTPTASADIISFAKSKGAYAGVSVEGAAVVASQASNEAYYGEGTRPVDILVGGTVANPRSLDLRDTVYEATKP